MKKLIAYFSATGKTAKLAELMAETIDADIYEIQPEKPYTMADLDWHNPASEARLRWKTNHQDRQLAV